MRIKDIDSHRRDLFESIKNGNYPSWTFYVQIMPEKTALAYKYDVLDCTKAWVDVPLVQVGKFQLNKNPENFFAEVE